MGNSPQTGHFRVQEIHDQNYFFDCEQISTNPSFSVP